ncbi:MAG: bile acid:sodium symporter family protein [Alphaproteobacteria bacterium]|nr:bile acid:sodium symporter family protein [Alphaproteobacteria bacterium]MBU0887219.1 bile acid:sodium symporter family protein [Alphaproteobacteria bacterium]MBU1812253.1 bile acid:sodium symporter family protein [Alphaproteobacteria bacterium]
MGIITDIVLPVSLAFIMFSIGLTLTIGDFRRVAAQPRDFLIGAASQILVLPLVAFALVSAWRIEPVLAVGVMIIAAAPGGVTSNLLTLFARGDVALSVSLTAITSLLSVVTVPLIVVAAHQHFVGGPAGELTVAGAVLRIFVIVTVPVLAGLAVRHRLPGFAQRFEPLARRISAVLFVLVMAGAIYAERANITTYFAQAGAITLTLNIAMMAIAFYGAAWLGLLRPQRIAIALECGLQNGTLAIAVAATLFQDTLYAIPAAIYSLMMFGTALAFVFLVTRGRPAAV